MRDLEPFINYNNIKSSQLRRIRKVCNGSVKPSETEYEISYFCRNF